MILYNRNINNGNPSQETVNVFPYEAEIIAQHLIVPWAIAISEEGKLYVTERGGRVRVIENGVLLTEPLITLSSPSVSRGESGLHGIALDPNFSENHYIYIMYSYTENGNLYNRIDRLVEEENTARIDATILDQIPGGQRHNGGRIKIGPDNKLYVTTGDTGNPSLPQDLSSLAGKILRLELDGSIPNDNPFPNSFVYAYGLRNPQGLAWNKEHQLYASEHGQMARDEINLILPGANYGWPIVEGNEESANENYTRPLISSGGDTWAPSGIAFVTNGPWSGKLLTATLRGSQLLSFTLNSEGTEVIQIESWLLNQYGRLREVIESQDGSIYLSTSNRDSRGNMKSGDDKIIRLILK